MPELDWIAGYPVVLGTMAVVCGLHVPLLPAERLAVSDEEGGDPVCWLHLACSECGAIPDPGEEELDAVPAAGRSGRRQRVKVGGDKRELG